MAGDSTDRRVRVPRLHIVTDDSTLARTDFFETAAHLLESGGRRIALHLRGPRTTARALHDHLERILPIAGKVGATLVVNDRVDVALSVPGAGVQLRESSLDAPVARRLLGTSRLIGRSIHTEEGLRPDDPVDFYVVGTIFETASHPGLPGAGPERVERVSRGTERPVIAIGGIRLDRVAAVCAAGAHGIAVLRGVWDADDPAAALGRYLGALEG